MTTTGRPGHKPSWHNSSRGYRDVIEGGAKIAAAILTAPVLRGPHNRWGAAPAEVSAAMPGDELVPKPKITSTRAITIDAPPHDVWPWLVQIGQGRGGFYSYDALENLARCDIHSADPKTRVAGPIPATPEEMASTWQWVLHPVDNGRGTRLVVRQRLSYPRRQSALWRLVEPVSFVMERRMLHGIKARAEGRRTAPSAETRSGSSS